MQCGVPKCAPCVNYEKNTTNILWFVVFLYFTQKNPKVLIPIYITCICYARSEKPTTINALHITKFTMLTGL